MNRTSNDVRWLHTLSSARGTLVGLALANFVIRLVRDYQNYQIEQSQPDKFTVSGGGSVAGMTEPLLLVIAAICVTRNRVWSCVISILLCLRVIYVSGYKCWRIAAVNTAEVPMFSWVGLEKLWLFYLESPGVLICVILATGIFAYAFLLLWRLAQERLPHVYVLSG
jgi:hypothetical protein